MFFTENFRKLYITKSELSMLSEDLAGKRIWKYREGLSEFESLKVKNLKFYLKQEMWPTEYFKTRFIYKFISQFVKIFFQRTRQTYLDSKSSTSLYKDGSSLKRFSLLDLKVFDQIVISKEEFKYLIINVKIPKIEVLDIFGEPNLIY